MSTALLVNMSRHLWSAVLTSHGTPWGRAMFKRMKTPKVGDLVVINSAPHAEPDTLIGTLLDIEQPRIDLDWEDKWDEEVEGRPCPTDPTYVLKLLDDGRTFRWVNVEVHALPRRQWAARKVIDDPETLRERNATLTEEIESLFRAPHGDYSPLGQALREAL